MPWMLDDLSRLAMEREAIENLQSNTTWLKGTSWGFNPGPLLRLDADIEVHNSVYQVRMIYPESFPANPPSVFPRNTAERWSTHQYGAGGELCLEWGPDNWLPKVTGSQLLESAYKLLQTENLEPNQQNLQSARVVSRHALSQGQEMRSSYLRFLCPDYLQNYFNELPYDSIGNISASGYLAREKSCITFITKVVPKGQEPWYDSLIPERIERYAFNQKGVYAKTNLEPSAVANLERIQQLQEILITNKNAYDCFVQAINDPDKCSSFLVVDAEGGLNLFWTSNDRKSLLFHTPIHLKSTNCQDRVRARTDILNDRKVGIVGLGSVGSKLAVILARSGVKDFVLVDDDLFLPENICRNELDWRSIGEHKTVAVEDQLSLIYSDIKVDVRRIKLTGQESASTVSGAMDALSKCDVIIDATADPEAFNQLAFISKQFKRTLIWLEIYGGGIGGMVARSRYGKDATPHNMREIYNAYTVETGKIPPTGLTSYAIEEDAGPIVASDADVGVMAAHAARFALDDLLNDEPSAFPYSMYIVGLKRGWVFNEPYHTIPIETGPFKAEQNQEFSDKEVRKGVLFLKELLENAQSGSPDAG